MFSIKFNKAIQILKYQINILNTIGLYSFLKYRLSHRDKLVLVSISNVDIYVRKGSKDLTVAMSCLGSEFEILRYLLPSTKNALIVDAGGYIGASALAFNRMFPNANIIVIEPGLDNLRILEKNTAGIDKIKVIHGALVGNDSGPVTLKNRGTGEWGYTIVEQSVDNANADYPYTVPSYKLSELPTNGVQIDLLKLDIEGAELDLLKLDRKTLQVVPFIFVELHERIIKGCENAFFEFSRDRVVIKDEGEKYLSVKIHN